MDWHDLLAAMLNVSPRRLRDAVALAAAITVAAWFCWPTSSLTAPARAVGCAGLGRIATTGEELLVSALTDGSNVELPAARETAREVMLNSIPGC